MRNKSPHSGVFNRRRKRFNISSPKMAEAAGVEPGTPGSKAQCATVTQHPRKVYVIKTASVS